MIGDVCQVISSDAILSCGLDVKATRLKCCKPFFFYISHLNQSSLLGTVFD